MDEFHTESAYPMISFERAWEIVAAHVRPLPPVEAGLREMVGCVLAEDVRSQVDVPSFPASRMDGYAVVAADTSWEREVLGEEDAGEALDVVVRPGTALRIMTGAPLPHGADAVIPVEDTSEEGGIVRLKRMVRPGENVRPIGSDLAKGEVAVPAGTVMGPAEIGLVATLGLATARIYPKPRVMVLATGDELVQPGQPLGPGQIYDSNSFALCAAVELAGGMALRGERVIDTEEALRASLLQAIEQADLVITSGGVSMGTRDLVKPVLESLGRIYFGRVAIKPGKPLTFAQVRGVPVFGLPGFPVSSLVTFEMVVRPAMRLLAGHRALWRPEVQARLSHPLRHDDDRTEFQRAVIIRRDGTYWASTTGAQASSRLKSLLGANALLRIPQGVGDVPEGATVTAILIDQPEQ
ncbi:MAG: molybdopterin molybdotransferase MoeA [Chloroflexi bacterium]|nr:molybdopterin molybdotransferase MoeA [Chloroflexota bacterium]